MNDLRHAPLTAQEREALNGGAWFASLSPTLRHDILRHASVSRHADGDLIAMAGQPAGAWLACARGAVQVGSTSANGRSVTHDYVEPGHWLGALDLLDELPLAHDLRAHGPTTLLRVSRGAFLSIRDAHFVELSQALLRLEAARTRRLFEQVEDLKTLNLRERLAKQLLELAGRHGRSDESGVRIMLRLAQWELAQMLGASRQRINEQLKHLEREAAIRRDAGGLVLCDLDALRCAGEGLAA